MPRSPPFSCARHFSFLVSIIFNFRAVRTIAAANSEEGPLSALAQPVALMRRTDNPLFLSSSSRPGAPFFRLGFRRSCSTAAAAANADIVSHLLRNYSFVLMPSVTSNSIPQSLLRSDFVSALSLRLGVSTWMRIVLFDTLCVLLCRIFGSRNI